MINANQQYVLNLIKKAIASATSSLENADTEDLDISYLSSIIRRSGILLTVYPTLEKSNDSTGKTLRSELNAVYLAALRQNILQEYEGQKVLDSFEENNIDSIALKGWVLRQLYPASTMRNMADLDILVRNYNYSTISSVMNQLGYSTGSESAWKHDNFAKPGGITVEMHKRLTDDSGYIQSWECRVWEHAALESGKKHIFLMSDEDYYIFHFIHLHKDFLNGSLGLRRITDTWIYNQAHQNMDWDYISREFAAMGLVTFHERILKLTMVIFENLPMDENSEILLKHAMTFGIYGTGTSYKIGRVASMSDNSMAAGKLKSWTAAVFLPYKRMKAHYPILQKYPVLLPFCWAKRITGHLKNLPKYKKMMNYSNLTREDYDEMKSFFKAGGLE